MDLLACSAGVFFGRGNLLARESAILRVAISTLHNPPLSQKQRWRLQRYQHKQATSTRPKVCLRCKLIDLYTIIMTTGAFASVGSYGFEPA